MSAVNSVSSSLGVEQRPYEPSMEEILASIRRIIADDHSLPGRAASRELPPEPSIAAPDPVAADIRGTIEAEEHSQPSLTPVHVLRPEIAVQGSDKGDLPPTLQLRTGASAMDEPPQAMTSDAAVAPRAHGSIAAPQFATPEGPTAWPMSAPPAAKTPYLDPPIPPEPSSTREDVMADQSEEPETESEDAAMSALFSRETDHSVTAAFKTLAATRLADNSDELLNLAREMIRPLLRSWIDDNLPSMVERMVRSEIERVARGGR